MSWCELVDHWTDEGEPCYDERERPCEGFSCPYHKEYPPTPPERLYPEERSFDLPDAREGVWFL